MLDENNECARCHDLSSAPPGYTLFCTAPLATWSPCKSYRYTLRRQLRLTLAPRVVAFLMLNPSTADEHDDDPTIRRCVDFAQSWGFCELMIVNVYAWRSTDPKMLPQVGVTARKIERAMRVRAPPDPVGTDNDVAILAACERAEMVVCAWGKNAKQGRIAQLRQLLAGQASKLHALKLNNDGSPAHPLYLNGSLRPQPFGLPEDKS